MTKLELLEQIGLLRVLLLVEEKRRYLSELKKTEINPDGVAALETVYKIRDNLVELGLIAVEIETGARPRTWLVITEKGRKVADLLRRIESVLEQ